MTLERNNTNLISGALGALGWVEHPDSADPGALGRLVERWLAAVPFENISRLRAAASEARGALRTGLTRPPGRPRAARSFWADHLAHGAGGTCFDIAAAARRLFRALGWPAHLRFAWPPGSTDVPHVVLRVESTSGHYLVDLGYALPVPLPLEPGLVVRESHAWYDLELRSGPDPGEYLLFTSDSRGRRFRYRLVDRPIGGAAWRAAWRVAGARDAHYMRRLALGRYPSEERILFHPSGRILRLSRDRQVETPIDAADAAALAAVFGLPEWFVREGLAALDGLGRPATQ